MAKNELAWPQLRQGASASLIVPYAVCELHKQTVIHSSSVGLSPANLLCKLITAWTTWSPEGALVLWEKALHALKGTCIC